MPYSRLQQGGFGGEFRSVAQVPGVVSAEYCGCSVLRRSQMWPTQLMHCESVFSFRVRLDMIAGSCHMLTLAETEP